ncbi:hypothetical protein [Spirosoma gilvum]
MKRSVSGEIGWALAFIAGLFGNLAHGQLRLADSWQSGMVIQRDQPVMKTANLVILLTVSSLLCLCSCRKKSDDVMPTQTTNTTPTSPGTTQATPAQSTTQALGGFQVNVDGYLYTPDLTYALTTSTGDDNYFGIYGLDSKTGNLVALLLPKTVGEGTLPIERVSAEGELLTLYLEVQTEFSPFTSRLPLLNPATYLLFSLRL